MKRVILIKNGELALKGQNRGTFEHALIRNLKRVLGPLGEAVYSCRQSTVTVEPAAEDYPFSRAVELLPRVFGVAGYSVAAELPKNLDELLRAAPGLLSDTLSGAKTFKVEAKRADKSFPATSPEICDKLGAALCEAYPELKVDVRNPEVTVLAEVRDSYIFLHTAQQKGAGGLPVGTGGRGVVLLSGGIDSPVAAWMMAKRGMELSAVHFASPPYTGPRSLKKVEDLTRVLSRYLGEIKLQVVPFTRAQEEISHIVPESFTTLVTRRFMMRIASRLAERSRRGALVTGESLGQVASQTLPAIAATDAVSSLPVLRPLIGFDKEDITRIARDIGTFPISSLPFEDCCTVFTPRHPRTNPKLEEVAEAESALDTAALVDEAVAGTEDRFISE